MLLQKIKNKYPKTYLKLIEFIVEKDINVVNEISEDNIIKFIKSNNSDKFSVEVFDSDLPEDLKVEAQKVLIDSALIELEKIS